MRTKVSIQNPLIMDRNRNALMKQLSASIAKAQTNTPKRKRGQQYDDQQDLQTLKKKQHIELNGQNQNLNTQVKKQYDRIFSKQKQIPIKPITESNPIFIYKTQKKLSKSITQKEALGSNTETLKPINLNQMLDHYPNNFGSFYVDDTKLFSEKERILISIQQKLDHLIIFLKEYRKKKKGELFSTIKKTFLENYRIFLEFSHLKKILYINENLYTIQKIGDQLSFDCLVDVRLNCKQSDTEALKNEMEERKKDFKKRLFAYKQNMQSNLNTKQFQIPEVKFKFEQVLEVNKIKSKENIKQIFDSELIKKKKLDRFFMLENKDSKIYQESKKNLERGMKKIQTMLKKQKQMELGMFNNKIFERRQLGEKEIKSVLKQMVRIYYDKDVMNMFEVQLIESLSKRLVYSETILKRIVEIMLTISSKISKSRPFLSEIKHKMGRLIKIDETKLSQFESALFSKKQWMDEFVFEIEMNGDYLKSKMQEQREKLFEELEKEEQQRMCQLNQNSNNSKKQDVIQSKNYVDTNLTTNKLKVEQNEQNIIEVKENKQESNDETVKDEYLCLPKDQFKSTLSNSEQLFYEDEQQVKCEAQCC